MQRSLWPTVYYVLRTSASFFQHLPETGRFGPGSVDLYGRLANEPGDPKGKAHYSASALDKTEHKEGANKKSLIKVPFTPASQFVGSPFKTSHRRQAA